MEALLKFAESTWEYINPTWRDPYLQEKNPIFDKRIHNELRIFNEQITSLQASYNEENNIVDIVNKGDTRDHISLVIKLNHNFPIYEPLCNLQFESEEKTCLLRTNEDVSVSDLLEKPWSPSIKIVDIAREAEVFVEQNSIPTREFESSMMSGGLMRVISKMGSDAPIFLVGIGLLVRAAIILYSLWDLSNVSLHRYDLAHIEHWLTTFRTSSLRDVILGLQGVAPSSKLAREIPFTPLLPIQSYFYYITTFISHHIFNYVYSAHSTDSVILHEEKVIVWGIGKVLLLSVDAVLLLFCVNMLVKYSYKNIRRDICYSYVALVVLCPTLFMKDYLHLELNSLGYNLIAFILLIIDTGDTVLVPMISAILMNTHLSYFWMIPTIFVATYFEARRTIEIRYNNSAKVNFYSLVEVAKMLTAFVLTNIGLWLPWIGHTADILTELWRIVTLNFFNHQLFDYNQGNKYLLLIPDLISLSVLVLIISMCCVLIASKHCKLRNYKQILFVAALAVSMLGRGRGGNMHLALAFLLVSPKEMRFVFSSMVFLMFFESDDDSHKYSPILMIICGVYFLLSRSFIQHSYKFFDERYRQMQGIHSRPIPDGALNKIERLAIKAVSWKHYVMVPYKIIEIISVIIVIIVHILGAFFAINIKGHWGRQFIMLIYLTSTFFVALIEVGQGIRDNLCKIVKIY